MVCCTDEFKRKIEKWFAVQINLGGNLIVEKGGNYDIIRGKSGRTVSDCRDSIRAV